MISHKHKCVFIHIPKCGGQSVEHIFLKENGLTWETRAPLLLRPNDDERLGPPRLAHLTYQDYIRYGYASAEMMQDYMTFSIVRDPFKRAESLYRFWGYDAAITFEQFVVDVLCREVKERGEDFWFFRPQKDFVCDESGVVLVDYLIDIDQMNSLLPTIFSKIGLKEKEVPHFNKSKSKKGFWTGSLMRARHARRGSFSFSIRVNNIISWTDNALEEFYGVYKKDVDLFDRVRLGGGCIHE